MQAAKVIVLLITQHSVFSCSVTAVQQLIFKSEENSPKALFEFFSPERREQSALSTLHTSTLTQTSFSVFLNVPSI